MRRLISRAFRRAGACPARAPLGPENICIRPLRRGCARGVFSFACLRQIRKMRFCFAQVADGFFKRSFGLVFYCFFLRCRIVFCETGGCRRFQTAFRPARMAEAARFAAPSGEWKTGAAGENAKRGCANAGATRAGLHITQTQIEDAFQTAENAFLGRTPPRRRRVFLRVHFSAPQRGPRAVFSRMPPPSRRPADSKSLPNSGDLKITNE